jgi:Transglutaminase-like superfamily
MKISVFLVVILLSIDVAFSQLIKINPEDGLLADELTEKLPDDDYISLKTEAVYTFPYSTKKQELQAKMTFNETILGLKESKYFIKYDFENTETFVNNLRVTNYKGKTIPSYGGIAKAKFKSAGIFHDDVKTAQISFFLATRGTRVNYTYEKDFFDVKYLTKAFFHSSYRNQEKSISFVIPPWLKLDFVEMNFEGYKIEKTETTKKIKGLINRIITYSMKDIKGVKNEALSAGYPISLPHIIILAKEYTYHKETHKLFSSTADLYRWYNSLTSKVENDNSPYKSTVESLTKNAKTDQEKIENIFYWVQDNIRYIAFEDGIMGFKPATDKNVYNNKYGDCKGMANLTCEMLKLAGFDARLTWIGTRKIPYSYDIPSLAVDNHMITTLMLGDKRYFLDATEKGVSFGDYAHRIQGQDVLIQDGDNYIIDIIPEFKSDHNEQSLNLELTLKEGKLIGKGSQKYKGEEKNKLFREFKYVSKTKQEVVLAKYLSNSNKNIEITNIKKTGLDNRNQDITFDYNLEISNQITTAGNEIYINLEKDYDFASLGIEKEENRVTDLNLGSKLNLNKTISLSVPSEYKIDYVPEPYNIDNDEFSILVSFVINGNTITYKKEITIKEGLITLKNLPKWNKAIKKLNKIYQDQVVLIKS